MTSKRTKRSRNNREVDITVINAKLDKIKNNNLLEMSLDKDLSLAYYVNLLTNVHFHDYTLYGNFIH